MIKDVKITNFSKSFIKSSPILINYLRFLKFDHSIQFLNSSTFLGYPIHIIIFIGLMLLPPKIILSFSIYHNENFVSLISNSSSVVNNCQPLFVNSLTI